MQRFRVYDKKNEEWVKNLQDFYLAYNNDLYISNKRPLGTEKLSLVSTEKYVYQVDIGLSDANGNLIFEGDICKIKHLEDVIGVITYVNEHASYYLLDYKNSKYYPLTEEHCRQIEIIGNIFENKDLISSEDNVKEGGQ